MRRSNPLACWCFALTLALAAAFPTAVGATAGEGYYEGIEAYRRGEYARAYAKLLPFAERGIASVQLRLGLMTYRGEGAPVDKPKAAEWYAKAAVQGAGEAQARLGAMYLRGDGIENNPALAAWWLERAANQDYGDAQYNMAYMYISGIGRPQDAIRAFSWLTRAVAGNYSPAVELRRRLAAVLSPTDLDRAYEIMLGLVPSHGGTGVVVSGAGHVLTAFHLVDGCRSVTVTRLGEASGEARAGGAPAQTLTRVGFDLANDLALMKLARPTGTAATLPRRKVLRSGQPIYHAGMRGNRPRLVVGKGRVDGLHHPNGDRRFVPLVARMAWNDSGGPVLDGRGRLVGLSLGWPQVLALTGGRSGPAKLRHFALSAAELSDFLAYYKVPIATAKAAAPILDDAGAVARMRAVTVGFVCRR